MSSEVSVPPSQKSVGYRVAALTTVVVPAVTVTLSAGRWATQNPLTFAESQLGPAALALLLGAAALIPVAVFVGQPGTYVVRGLAIATVGAGVPLWAAWPWLPAEARSAVLAASPLVILGVAMTASSWSGRPARRVLRASYLIVALAVLVHLLAYNPFADPGCARTCVAVSVPLEMLLSTRAAATVAAALTLLGAVLGSLAVLRSGGPAMLKATGLAALGLVGVSTVSGWSTWGNSSIAGSLILIAPVAPGVLAGGICLVALRTARTRAAMSRLVASLASPEQSLQVAYAVPGSDRWVNVDGEEAPGEGSGLVLSDESGPALRIELSPDTDQAQLLAALTPATRLALRNTQLAAAANARLIDVQASQRRIISTSDGERHRIERDLHDGAQQRLVSALFQLQVVAPRLTAADRRVLVETDGRLRTVLAHLRRLDLDPFPETLGTEGLAPALEELVANSTAPVRLDTSIGHVPDEIGRAVYALAAAAAQSGSLIAEAALEVEGHEGSVYLRAELWGVAEMDQGILREAVDRIGSVGGSVSFASYPSRGLVRVEAVIPCGS